MDIGERLTEDSQLLERIDRIARKYDWGRMTVDDARQFIYLRLLEKGEVDRDFGDRGRGYLVKAAVWAGRKYAEQCATYDKWMDGDWLYREFPGEAGERVTYEELLPDDAPLPDQVCETREALAILAEKINRLNENQKAVVLCLMQGWSVPEIARYLGVSADSVRHFKARAKAALSA